MELGTHSFHRFPLTANDLNTHLNILYTDLRENTVDRVIYGDPERGIAVAWMPYQRTIQEAIDAGANVLVTHERRIPSKRRSR
jgi:hypothetical protein